MDRLTVKDIYFLVKRKARLTDEEFDSIKTLKIFDLIIESAFNMLTGDGAYTPDTPEYKVLMPLCAMLDSIIDTQPFVNVKDNYLGGYSVSEVIEPMLFNNYAPDRTGTLNLTKIPQSRVNTPVYRQCSHGCNIFSCPHTVSSSAVSYSNSPARADGKKDTQIKRTKRTFLQILMLDKHH